MKSMDANVSTVALHEIMCELASVVDVRLLQEGNKTDPCKIHPAAILRGRLFCNAIQPTLICSMIIRFET